VLTAYWGFLSSGGLVIPDEDSFDEGQPVSVNVHIASQKAEYALFGRIVRRQTASRRAVIAFDPGEPHDMLLTAALSETDDVPARRHPRHATAARVQLTNGAGAVEAQLLDISAAGCCVRVHGGADGAFVVGDHVHLSCNGVEASGTVVWAHGHDRGVSFDDAGCAAAAELIRDL
jgi:hypothetical protein